MSYLLLLLLLVPFWVIWDIYRHVRDSSSFQRHQRCLTSIKRLERELFPEWFREFDGWSRHYAVDRPYVSCKVDYLADELPVQPGAVWPVDSPNYVQSIPARYFLAQQQHLLDQHRQSALAMRGLLRSGMVAYKQDMELKAHYGLVPDAETGMWPWSEQQ